VRAARHICHRHHRCRPTVTSVAATIVAATVTIIAATAATIVAATAATIVAATAATAAIVAATATATIVAATAAIVAARWCRRSRRWFLVDVLFWGPLFILRLVGRCSIIIAFLLVAEAFRVV
jgi:spore maturation protein SpmA